MQTVERLKSLMEHLRLEAAHFATQVPGDIAGLAATLPERISGLVLCVPMRLDARPLERVAPRLLMISGDTGLSAEVGRRAHQRLPAAQWHALPGYAAMGWSDVIADRTAEVAGTIVRFLTGDRGQNPIPNREPGPALAAGSGIHAGLTYRIEGHGPPLILLPFFLAPSQWQPALPELARHFTVIQLGGPHIGGVAALEDRARAPTYQAMFRTLVDLMAPEAASRILDVGCGSGALDRLLAARLGPAARIDAVDVNPFLLREAADLAVEFGERIRFAQGSALALPFADRTFDCIFSVTVLEECDADRAIAEMVRIARPGARIGLVVRAIDIPQWWNLALPAEIRAKAEIPPQSVSPSGVADASLYARMRRAGLVDLRAFPALVTLDEPGGPIWRYREDHVLSQLSLAETAAWHAARVAAAEAGLLMQAHALHCAVASKPVCS
jgi:ubiquinone/menaquinone biosynthesis C-methylase UbiE